MPVLTLNNISQEFGGLRALDAVEDRKSVV